MDAATESYARLPRRLKGLGELADNLWWSWHPEARMLFKSLDRQAWKESIHNPVKMLNELPQEVLESAAKDQTYLRHMDAVLGQFRKEMETRAGWFLEHVLESLEYPIAYFSAEYGLHRSLPFYAGGLGFLAGDHLKECSDLGVPLVAVGFMYPEGYLRQQIGEDGWQRDVNDALDRDAAPIARVLDENGEHLIVQVPFMEPPIHVAVWKVAVGRVPLYLMDTDIERNAPWNRAITARLYVGNIEQRLRQEIVLGIGGCQVLQRLGIQHSALHLNEGHPAFALLEKTRARIQQGVPFEEAAREVRRSSIFTTHTPVPAGHDVFPFYLMEKYFNVYWPSLGLDHDSFMNLGIKPGEKEAGFNMTAFALQMCEYRNAVSQRHGEVTRQMWQVLWPEQPPDKIPIDFVTNGIHVPTWLDPKMVLLFNKYLGPNWLQNHDDPVIWKLIDDIPDEELWETHFGLKMKLINAVREYLRQRWARDRIASSNVVAGGTLLDPTVLTIGFARRFATYKRANLVFSDFERLKKLLHSRWQPVQFIFAGKAHPADDPGKRVLQQIFNLAHDPRTAGRVAFVEDYGEQLAQYLVHGVDVWLNNPVPPQEASGTSGMKAAMNGVPNLSILDGWWLEGFNGKNGWAFGQETAAENRHLEDAEAIYSILENDIIPLFYERATDGVPRDWVKVMKTSIKSVAPKFSARRMVKDYCRKMYCKSVQT
ncbi:MAG: alpha-glucan family phosphorylase [bacterium]